jgi:hypothetical protein
MMSPLYFSRRQVIVAAGATLVASSVRMLAVPSPAYADTGYSPTVYYKIKNVASGRLLSVLGGGTNNGDNDILYDDVNKTDQFWYIQDSAQGYKKFINVRSGRALSLNQGATANGTLVHLWQYLNGYPDQDWLVAPGTTSGTVTISERRHGKQHPRAGLGQRQRLGPVVADHPGADVRGPDRALPDREQEQRIFAVGTGRGHHR